MLAGLVKSMIGIDMLLLGEQHAAFDPDIARAVAGQAGVEKTAAAAAARR